MCFWDSRSMSTTVPADVKHRKIVIESIGTPKENFFKWAALKYEQYNITSVLYVLDAWERVIFNIILASVFLATVLAMYVYIHASVPLFFLSIILFGFIIFLLLLCPLHQF